MSGRLVTRDLDSLSLPSRDLVHRIPQSGWEHLDVLLPRHRGQRVPERVLEPIGSRSGYAGVNGGTAQLVS
jgi:predicted metalloenzyme YecM